MRSPAVKIGSRTSIEDELLLQLPSTVAYLHFLKSGLICVVMYFTIASFVVIYYKIRK